MPRKHIRYASHHTGLAPIWQSNKVDQTATF